MSDPARFLDRDCCWNHLSYCKNYFLIETYQSGSKCI
nr:MAG TPA: hypothetical protein [Caudoviricetes sp.]